jgi:hypothetical protein
MEARSPGKSASACRPRRHAQITSVCVALSHQQINKISEQNRRLATTWKPWRASTVRRSASGRRICCWSSGLNGCLVTFRELARARCNWCWSRPHALLARTAGALSQRTAVHPCPSECPRNDLPVTARRAVLPDANPYVRKPGQPGSRADTDTAGRPGAHLDREPAVPSPLPPTMTSRIVRTLTIPNTDTSNRQILTAGLYVGAVARARKFADSVRCSATRADLADIAERRPSSLST